MRILALSLVLAACGRSDRLTVHVPTDLEPAMADMVGFLDDDRASLDTVEPAGRGVHVQVEVDLDCGAECYRLERREDEHYVVHAGGTLGAQFGVAHVMEGLGYRFYHPFHTRLPSEFLDGPADADLDVEHTPQTARRGLHMHTLHPIEGLYDFWVPSDAGQVRAHRVIDWVVKNRGNHVQWVALDDITGSDATRAAWASHTAGIQDKAKLRGVTTGVGIQLYGSGNLQLAFDLVDDLDGNVQGQIDERLARIGEGVDFDVYNLSFGEFFSEGPERFLADTDLAVDRMHAMDDTLDTTAVVHVGADLRVEYEGEDLLYYMLVKHADERLVPWVHTTMYYDLFDPVNGAYHHEAFDEHRDFLFERLQADKPVGYFPETAYWVAFDNSVPQYLPLYVRNRWEDLHTIRSTALSEEHATLQDHVQFSSGWEWGYWQQDVMTLRAAWAVPDDPEVLFEDQLGVLGDQVAALVADEAEAQEAAHVDQGLAPWLMGVDAIMEIGYARDIVSQPRRPYTWKELTELDADAALAFRDETVTALAELSQGSLLRRDLMVALAESDDPWAREIYDGFAINDLRARYMAALLLAATAEALDEDPSAYLVAATQLLEEARIVVARRHAALHDPESSRLLQRGANPTLYQYGYLFHADSLCYWDRDRAQVRTLVLGTDEEIPGCAF